MFLLRSYPKLRLDGVSALALPLALRAPYPLTGSWSQEFPEPSGQSLFFVSFSLWSTDWPPVHTEVLIDMYFPGIIFHNQFAFVESQFTGGLTVGRR